MGEGGRAGEAGQLQWDSKALVEWLCCSGQCCCTSAESDVLSMCLLPRCCCGCWLQALRVLLQQRVSAVAVLAGSGPSPNMRLVGNLSASDLRHLRKGGFGGLALSVKAFLASKPLAPDQVGFGRVWGGGARPAMEQQQMQGAWDMSHVT